MKTYTTNEILQIIDEQEKYLFELVESKTRDNDSVFAESVTKRTVVLTLSQLKGYFETDSEPQE